MKLAEVRRVFVATDVKKTELEKICLDTTVVFETMTGEFYFVAWYPTGSCSISDITQANDEQTKLIRKALS